MLRVTFFRAVTMGAAAVVLGSAGSVRAASRPSLLDLSVPIAFEENLGQSADCVRFLSWGPGYQLFLSAGEAVFTFRTKTSPSTSPFIRIALEGASPDSRMHGAGQPISRSHYFVGNDPRRWTTNVPLYPRVESENVYPGIDIQYHATDGRLEYDFVVRPGADPSSIRLRITGAERVAIDETGALSLSAGGRELIELPPAIYQGSAADRSRVPGGFVLLAPDRVGFHVESYDRERPLVIDPQVLFSSYAGGSDRDELLAVAMDSFRNVYAAGLTASLDYPTAGAPATGLHGELDCVVSKWSASGDRLIYSAYVGGSGLDLCAGLAVDGLGRAYLVGTTDSRDFPSSNALRSVFGGGTYDAFTLELSPQGSSLVFSTYWGGMGDDFGFGIALSGSGAPVVSGATSSLDFPTFNAFQAGYGGGPIDGFVSRLTASGSAVVYSTFLGGSDDDQALDLAVDTNGSVAVTGVTLSSDFPLLAPVQEAGGSEAFFDAFVTELGPSGALAFSTYLGGGEIDIGFDVAFDRRGRILVVGGTMSDDFPTTRRAFQPTLHGVMDGFVTAIDGSTLSYSTYLGGSSGEFVLGVDADPRGRAIVTGFTSSDDFPLEQPTQSQFGGGASDAFLAKLSADGRRLVFSTYHGGSGQETADALATDGIGRAVIAGGVDSSDLPVTVAAFQRSPGGGDDGFVAGFATQTTGAQIRDLEVVLGDVLSDSRRERRSLLARLRGARLAIAGSRRVIAVRLMQSFLEEIGRLTANGTVGENDSRLLIEMASGILDEIR